LVRCGSSRNREERILRRALIVCEPGDGDWQSRRFGVAKVFRKSLARRGWCVAHERDSEPDLVVGWGWSTAHGRWPDRAMYVDLGVWGRAAYKGIHDSSGYYRLALGGRWMPLRWTEERGDSRAMVLGIAVQPSRPPGKRVLVVGQSRKGCTTLGLEFQAWERDTTTRLLNAGATVTYRARPREETPPIDGAAFDKGSQPAAEALAEVDAVASHSSNMTIDALAAGLPVYCEAGYALTASTRLVEELVGAEAADIGTRRRICHEVAWHQWTLPEIAAGAWMRQPAPLSEMFDA
jgi:hypothetical protein